MRTTMRLVGWMMIAISVGGCSTYRTAPISGSGELPDRARSGGNLSGIVAGDHVKVGLVDGSELKGRVLQVSPEELTLTHGEHVRADKEAPVLVPVEDIAEISRKEPSAGKTAGLVLGIIGGLVGALALAVAVGGGMSVNFGG